MKSNGYIDWGPKSAQAQRSAGQRGKTYIVTNAWHESVSGREKRDEAEAYRAYGVRVSYDDVRSQNVWVWRQ